MTKRIASSAAIYIGGELVNKAIPFLLLPFLTAFLSPNDFGVVATYQAIMQVLLVLTSLSMHAAISVLFFKLESDFFKKMLASIFMLSLSLAIICTLLVTTFQQSLMFFLGVDIFWVIALPSIVLFQAFAQFFLVFYQVRKMQKQYVTFQLLNTLVNVSVSVVLIAYWNIGLEGRIAGIAIAAIIFGMWSLFNLKHKKELDFNVTKESFLTPLRFSLPLIPHSLSSWIKTSVDRVLLMTFMGAVAVGEYAVMYQMAMILSVVFMAANKAIVPFLFEKMKSINLDNNVITVICYKTMAVIILISICFMLLLPVAFDLFINESYNFHYQLAILLITGFMFQGLYFILINFLMFHEKTNLISKVAIVNSIFHLLIAFPLIYFHGALGAAITNCLSWSILFLLTLYQGNRSGVYPWSLRLKSE